MSDETLVTAAEIARLAGVGRAAVGNWRRRHPDFPEPVIGERGTPTFRLDEVQRWLRDQGRTVDRSPSDVVWQAFDGDVDELAMTADIAAHLLAPADVELPERMLAALAELADVSPEDVVESLCTRVFERQQRQQLVTPPPLARLMVELAGPVEGTVFDPACGPGNVLLAAADAGADSVAGQELDENLARLATARLAMRLGVHIETGDSLRADCFGDRRADIVLCDPPFGYRDWGHEELALDPRWEYGFPVKGEPELAWVQHCLAHLEPGGTAVIALPAGVALRRSGRAIRQALLRRGAIRAVIALPGGVRMSTGIPVHLWVLRNPAEQGVAPVLLVDTAHHRPLRRGRADWTAIERDIVEAWREFRETGTVGELAGQRRAVEPIELLDEDVDLTPARHLPHPVADIDVRALERARKKLAGRLSELDDLLPKVRKTATRTNAYTTVGELAKAGALVLRQAGALDTAERGRGPRVLTGREVVTGQKPTLRYTGSEPDTLIRLRPGDLVVPMLAAGDGTPRTRIITDDDLVLGPNLQLIRVDDSKLDVGFLAGQLRAGSKARTSTTTASGIHRLDIRRAEIPVLPLEQQRVLGEAFRKLDAFEVGLRAANETGHRIATQLSAGLADGTIEPAR